MLLRKQLQVHRCFGRHSSYVKKMCEKHIDRDDEPLIAHKNSTTLSFTIVSLSYIAIHLGPHEM